MPSPIAPWLNYHHLLYFWTVAKEGSVTKASKQLRLAQPTVSSQLKALEDSLGEKLLEREGRGLRLTEMGKVVFQYADEIFNLGRELVNTVQRKPGSTIPELRVGITDALPKTIVYQLLEPALKAVGQIKVICQEGVLERLVGEMAMHELDLVVSDTPTVSSTRIQSYNHLLGESGTSFFASEKLYKEFHRDFPRTLVNAPFLMPLRSAAFRRGIEEWFDKQGSSLVITGEFDDSALLKAFGGAGTGIFAAATVMEDEIKHQFGLKILGRAPDLRQSFYAITVERKIKHPAVAAICEKARGQLFAKG